MGMICYSNLINSDSRTSLNRILGAVDLFVDYLMGQEAKSIDVSCERRNLLLVLVEGVTRNMEHSSSEAAQVVAEGKMNSMLNAAYDLIQRQMPSTTMQRSKEYIIFVDSLVRISLLEEGDQSVGL